MKLVHRLLNSGLFRLFAVLGGGWIIHEISTPLQTRKHTDKALGAARVA